MSREKGLLTPLPFHTNSAFDLVCCDVWYLGLSSPFNCSKAIQSRVSIGEQSWGNDCGCEDAYELWRYYEELGLLTDGQPRAGCTHLGPSGPSFPFYSDSNERSRSNTEIVSSSSVHQLAKESQSWSLPLPWMCTRTCSTWRRASRSSR